MRFFVRSLVLVLSLGSGACTLVGYPGGAPGSGVAAVGVPYPTGSGGHGGAGNVGEGAPAARAAGGPAAANPGVRPSDAGRTYQVFGVEYKVLDSAEGYDEEGTASWYGPQFHGRPTASGETFDQHAVSAAHRTLPLHTWVEVENLANGRTVVLRINDRGPFARTHERIIDLSYGAARQLDLVGAGTGRVRVRALSRAELSQLR